MTREPYDAYLQTPWGDTIHYSSSDYSVGVDFATTGAIFPHELDVLGALVTSGDTVIDVGANNGYLACYFAYLVGATGHVYAIEPASQEFQALLKNLHANGHTNTTCSQVLFGEAPGVGQLWLSSTNLGRHSLYPTNVTGTVAHETVPVTTADRYLDEVVHCSDDIDLVKIDVEGAESLVL